MKDGEPLTGIVLAGGKSSRMNRDKGLIRYKQKPFVQHIIAALQPLVDEIIIVSDDPQYDVFAQRRVEDWIKNVGPLAGIYTGLSHAKTRDSLILSCDIPLINSAVLSQLINRTAEPVEVVQMQCRGKTMPLVARYKKTCMQPCLRLIESGERRVRFFVDQLRSKTIVAGDSTAKYILNINTPNELKKLNHGCKH
ncbi:MAG: molybdenum cofactor guanylyltransferase [Flavobacteriales bacterium]